MYSLTWLFRIVKQANRNPNGNQGEPEKMKYADGDIWSESGVVV